MNWLLAFGALMLGATIGATLIAIIAASARHRERDRTLEP
jgi:hypothetical protein